jgi:glycosyltransferase involved in cell wall biosynthesis
VKNAAGLWSFAFPKDSVQEILIDVTRLVHRFMAKRLPTGVDRVSLAYISHYRSNARAVLRHNGGKFVFRHAESATLFDWLLSLGGTGSPLPTIYKGLVAGCLLQGVAGRFLFNTGHSGLESDDYVTMLKQQRVKPIFMVHDLIPLTHPQYCRAGEHDRHLTRLRNAVRAASGIVCNSQATLDGLRVLCGQQGWDLPPAVVALLAPEKINSVRLTRPMAAPYFVFVSTIEPRKNHLMILKIWQRLAVQLGDKAPHLVIIGQRGWDYGAVVELLEDSTLKPLVTEIPACTDPEMVNYLQHARALLFPSFTEGFGMPVVEALAVGLPVIASDLPVFKEFAGAIPSYIDIHDEALWTATIADYAKADSLLRAEQLTRMENYAPPSWAAHFSQVDALLERLARSEAPHA